MEQISILIDKIAFGIYEIRSLAAQETTALWTMLMAIFTLLAAIFAAIAAYLAFRSLRSAQRTSKLQNDAYVYALAAEYGKNNNVLVTIKNTGLTPASHFSVNCLAKIVPNGSVEASVGFASDGFKTWSALGAGQEETVSALDLIEVYQNFKHMLPLPGSPVLMICGQIKYTTMANERHLTQFVFYVHQGEAQFLRPTNNLKTFHLIVSGSWWQFWKKKPLP